MSLQIGLNALVWICLLLQKGSFVWFNLFMIPQNCTFPSFVDNILKNRKGESDARLWNDSFFGVWMKELTVRSSTLPLFSFLSSQCFPLRLLCEGCLLESRDLWPLAAAHMFAVKPLDWIMPVFMKWGEETLAKSWPRGTLFLCGLIWAVPAERTAKKDSRKYFLCISLWHDFIWFLWYFFFT